jgi:hypothetical protein
LACLMPLSSVPAKAAHAYKPLAYADDAKTPDRQPYTSRRVYTRFLDRLKRFEAQAYSRCRRKPITKLSHKVVRPIQS